MCRWKTWKIWRLPYKWKPGAFIPAKALLFSPAESFWFMLLPALIAIIRVELRPKCRFRDILLSTLNILI